MIFLNSNSLFKSYNIFFCLLSRPRPNVEAWYSYTTCRAPNTPTLTTTSAKSCLPFWRAPTRRGWRRCSSWQPRCGSKHRSRWDSLIGVYASMTRRRGGTLQPTPTGTYQTQIIIHPSFMKGKFIPWPELRHCVKPPSAARRSWGLGGGYSTHFRPIYTRYMIIVFEGGADITPNH